MFDAYISYVLGDVIIVNAQYLKKLTLYPLTKPFLETIKQLWINLEEGNTLFEISVQPIITTERALP
jgi:hypothetical protein